MDVCNIRLHFVAAPTPAMITVLNQLEIYKYVKGMKHAVFRQACVDVGVNSIVYEMATNPIRNKSKRDYFEPIITCIPEGFTCWDWTVIDADPGLTVKQFCNVRQYLCLLCIFSASNRYTFLSSDDSSVSKIIMEWIWCPNIYITCEDANNGRGCPIVTSIRYLNVAHTKLIDAYVDFYGPVRKGREYILLEDDGKIAVPRLNTIGCHSSEKKCS